jgi:DnaA-homolog protein
VTSSPQLILDLAQPEPPTLQNFVVGANGEAVAAVRALAHANLPHPGLLLWGAPGGGKSHLVQAAIGNVRAAGRSVIVCGATIEAPEPTDAPNALLVIDDVDAADAPTQARLFTLVNAWPAQGGQWLATAKLPPARLPVRDDLRTRLALGLVLEVVPLADADKPAALAAYARERGFALSDDVIMYLLAHARRDMKSLVATLAAIDRQSLATKRNVTVPLLREWLQHELGLSR